MKIVVRSSLLCVFKCFPMFLQNVLQLMGMSKSFASQKVYKSLTLMLVMRKALEGAKGRMINKP